MMELKFDKDGLIPAIVVDDDTGRVLTLAYMNQESLAVSTEKGQSHNRINIIPNGTAPNII